MRPRPAGEVLDALLHIVDDAVLTLDHDGCVRSWNGAAVRIFGVREDEVVAHALPDSLVAAKAAIEAAWAGSHITHVEVDVVRPDGLAVPISLSASVAGDQLVVVARDITERQVAQAALGEAEIRVRESEAAGHVGAWLWDIRTGAVQWSDELHRIAGVDPTEFDGTVDGLLAVVHPDDRWSVRAAMDAAERTATPARFRIRLVRRDGGEHAGELTVLPTLAPDGAVAGLRGTVREL